MFLEVCFSEIRRILIQIGKNYWDRENIICQICFLGLWVIPNAYTLRHARGYGRSALRNWQFQVSKDGVTWTTLYDHLDDQSLNDPGKIFF